jgi:capsid protein
VDAPGYLEDPDQARSLGRISDWLGRAPIVLDAVKDANAAEKWIDLGVKTVESSHDGNDRRRLARKIKSSAGARVRFAPISTLRRQSPVPPKPEARSGRR